MIQPVTPSVLAPPLSGSPFTANGEAVSELDFQAHALNLNQHVVIEACAGSGKTWLLTARLLRLLLAGHEPQSILAITFTRKATQEMKQRLADMLSLLHRGEAYERSATLRALGLQDSVPLQQVLAHCWERSFERGDWPQIATFHEWFASIRKAAPFSLQSAPGAELVDDVYEAKQTAWQTFWEQTKRDSELAAQVTCGISALGLQAFEQALESVFDRRAEWLVYASDRTPAQAHQAFHSFLQVKDLPEIVSGLADTVQTLRKMIGFYEGSNTPSANKRAVKIQQALTLFEAYLLEHDGDLDAINAVADGVLSAVSNVDFKLPSSKNMAYKDMLGPIETQFEGGTEAFIASFHACHEQALTARSECQTLRLLPAHRAVLIAANALIHAYQQAKAQQSVVDFTDLELEALAVLQATQGLHQARDLPWLRSEHILLDEFQDTNPIQWQALQAFLTPLLNETKAGGRSCSLFIVGDPKQSIYRFRRADPLLFKHVAIWLQTQYNAVLLRTQRTRRNTVMVNQCVNHVFASPQAVHPIFSEQFTQNPQVGSLQLLPLIEKPLQSMSLETETLSDLDLAPRVQVSANRRFLEDALDDGFGEFSVYAAETEQITRAIQRWRTLNPNTPWTEVMVLARRNAPLQVLAMALHAAQIPCICDVKGGFFSETEVADVMALLAALHQPSDAIATLTALRSPIFAISNAQLSELLRHFQSLETSKNWCGLASLAQPWAEQVTICLKQWQWLAKHLPMHDALDAMFDQGQFEARFCAASTVNRRPWIRAILEQLLSTALNVDGGRYPSLPRFLSAIGQLKESDLLGTQRATVPDAVRLSTIHSAKGLEAELVILMDTGSKPKADNKIQVLMDWPATAERASYFGVQLGIEWAGQAAHLAAQNVKQAQALEAHTLLYVALTRARSALWISGTAKKNNPDSIYLRMQAAVHSMAQAQSWAFNWADWKLDSNQVPTPLPVLTRPLPPLSLMLEAPMRKALQPSYTPNLLMQRGTVLHAALQGFMQYGALPGPHALLLQANLPLADIHQVLNQARQMIDGLCLPALRSHSQVLRFALEQAYVNGAGALLRPDLVVYGADFTWLLDYKTHFSPANPLAQSYAAQLAAYLDCLPTGSQAYLLTVDSECWQYGAGTGWQLTQPPWHKLSTD